MGKKKRKEGEEGKKVNRDFRGDDRGHILGDPGSWMGRGVTPRDVGSD